VTALLASLFWGILTLWVPGRWALSVLEVALFALLFQRIARRIRAGGSFHLHPVAWLLGGAAAWGLVQVAGGWTVYRLLTQEAALNWFTNLVAFSLALSLSCSQAEREQFFRATLVFATFIAVLSIFTVLTSPPGMVFWRFAVDSDLPTLGPFVYRNQYAAFVEAILPIVIVQAIRDKRRRMLYTIVTATLFGSVVAGGSRTGTALCLAEILAVPALAFARGMVSRRQFMGTVLGSLIAVAVFTGVVGWETIWKRFQEPNAYAMRLQFVKSSFAMVRDRPWTGFGLGTWSAAYPAYALFDDGLFANQAHNDWIQWAAEGGILFFIMVLAIAMWSLSPALRSVWGIGLLTVFVHCLVDYPMQQRPALPTLFFAMLGILAGEENRRRPTHEAEDRLSC
jgi:O-antigen ligase